MLGLAKRVKARILLASTSEIYGDPAVHPQPESYWGNVNTIGPRVSMSRCMNWMYLQPQTYIDTSYPRLAMTKERELQRP